MWVAMSVDFCRVYAVLWVFTSSAILCAYTGPPTLATSQSTSLLIRAGVMDAPYTPRHRRFVALSAYLSH